MNSLTTSNQSEVAVNCYHCGDLCPDQEIYLEEKYFCCLGCKTVFEILDENGLCDYYELENNPGISLKNKDFEGKYDYLVNESIQRKLLDFSSEKRNKIRFTIPAIHCSSCIWLLENLDKLKEGVILSKVNFIRKQLSLDYDPGIISLKEIVETLASLGYEPEITLDSYKKGKQKSASNSLLLKMGVAGFSFGNIMLLSFPEYFGLEVIDPMVISFFPWFIMILSLPVFLYCGWDYFVSAYKGLKARFISIDVPIALGITALFLESTYQVITETGPGYFDSLAGLLFFLLIGKWFQSKTYQNLSFERDYKSYFPLAATVVREEGNEIVPVQDIQVGDRIRIRNQELIPGDALLLSENATIDYSFVTGESLPDNRLKGDYIYAGGRNAGSAIELVVEKEISQSYLTQLWNNKAFNDDPDSASQLLINRVSKYFTSAILLIAVVSALVWAWIEPSQSIIVFTATLIVACPCALALSVPFTWGSAMRVLGRNGLYIRNAEVIEKLAGIDTIVFDKTGTITQSGKQSVNFIGDELSSQEKELVYNLVSNSGHPLSRSIMDSLGTLNPHPVSNFEEIKGRGIQANVNGNYVKMGSSRFLDMEVEYEAENASRVYLNIDKIPRGYFEIHASYRSGLKDLISSLASDYQLSLLSGDHDGEKEKLAHYFGENEMIFNQLPDQKLEYVKDLQEKGSKVLMIGDGLNDAGALRQANSGIAVTDNISQFTPASDAIMDASSFSKINNFLSLGRVSLKVVMLSFAISFLYNIVGLSFAVTGNLTPVFAAILMPLSSISVVLFTTISIGFVAKKIKL